MTNYPGTKVPKGNLSGREFIDNLFLGTNGLVMSQLNDLTGVQTPALQNWINRGFMSRPVKKRYNKDQTARILIINVLRGIMQLEDVKKLLIYVNGNPEDTSDDIIAESELYSHLCDIVFDKNFSFYKIDELVKKSSAQYTEKIAGARERLEKALKIICMNYLASLIQAETSELLSEM